MICNERAEKVYEKIIENKNGIRQIQLAKELGMLPCSVKYVVRQLEKHGFVKIEKVQNVVTIYPKESV